MATARRIGAIALIAGWLLAALVFPASAPATRGLVTGLTGQFQYQNPLPDHRALWFDRTVDADAGIVRLILYWRLWAPQRPAAPTDPNSYANSPRVDLLYSLDGAVRDAAARGVQTLISVNSAPQWAEGPGRPASAAEGSWKPNPSDLADFIQAIATRYSGSFDPDGAGAEPPLPAVQALQVWNEPNHERWLTPQFRGGDIVGADQYRELLNASYRAIKAVNPRMLVVAGGTSPYGDPPGGPYDPAAARVRPVQWWQKLLCVNPAKRKSTSTRKAKKRKRTRYARAKSCSGEAMFDVFAHQPIDNTGGGPLTHGPHRYDASTPDLGRVVSVLRAAERLGTVSSGQHPVWVTEFWWDSKPPNPAGAPLLTQARWIEQSLYLFWKAGADAAINFQVRDSGQLPDVRAGFQSGLYFLDGRPKPALTAFRFPFVTERIDQRTLRAWGKAPEGGTLLIQRQRGKHWATVKKLNLGKGQVFLTKLRLRGKQRLRATVGSSTSVVWKQAGFAKPR